MLGVLLSFLFLASTTPATLTAHTIHIEDAPTSTTSIAAYTRQVQHEFGLGDDFYKTMEYESWGFQNIQSQIPNSNGPNGKENSWGVCQIHLDSHPTITMTQALSPAWCLSWSANEFKEGRAYQWTGWRLLQQGKI